jgi:hypothetical protein
VFRSFITGGGAALGHLFLVSLMQRRNKPAGEPASA